MQHERRTRRVHVALTVCILTACFRSLPLGAQLVDPCRPPIGIDVVRTACRFGTAEARVRAEEGAQIAWRVDGARIIAGHATPTIVLSFGATDRATISATVSAHGCTATGAVEITLREPLAIDALMVLPAAPLANELATIVWGYRGSALPKAQRLRIGEREVQLEPSVRSFAFTPDRAGALDVTLDASALAGGKRRAVRTGDPLPPASSCVAATRTASVSVAPACTRPTATVSGGGAGCGSVGISATFTGTPPFSGRWTDEVPFSTPQHVLTRTVEQSGTYAIAAVRDAHCDGTSAGAATAEVTPEARATSLTASRAAVQMGGDSMPLHFTFTDAVACTVTAALNNVFDTRHPPCTGSGTGVVHYAGANEAGRETVTLTVTGACGPADTRAVSFNVCWYLSSVTADGPTTVPAGSAVPLRAQVPVTVPGGASPITAGGPYTFAFFRCPATGQCLQPVVVQSGPSDAYAATVSGTYYVRTADREGCDSYPHGGVTVTIGSPASTISVDTSIAAAPGPP